MAYQRIALLFIAMVICNQASAQDPVSAPVPTTGADVPMSAPVSTPVVAPVLPPTVSTPPAVAPTVSTPPMATVAPSVTPTVAPTLPPSMTPSAVPVVAPVSAPVSEVPTPSSEFAPAPGPSQEDSSAMMVGTSGWSMLVLSSGLLVALAY